jgi:uncharacterized membrane protein YphA (DoxX/SURF4 family)
MLQMHCYTICKKGIIVDTSFVVWPSIAGLVILAIGLISVRRELTAAPGLDKLIVWGPVFVAAPLAVFAGEHLAGARLLMQGVPTWMPARLFWAYFVGLALLAAAFSLALKKYLRWSAPLLALMFFLFVLSIHIPGLIEHPKDRIFWTIVLRDSSFAAGALALTGTILRQRSLQGSNTLIAVARICIAVPLVVFGIEHLLHPAFAPGVPLPKLTPTWVPAPFLFAYLVGALLLVAGTCLLINKWSRIAATYVGLVMTLLTLLLYVPILAMDRGTAQLSEGLNYVGDTLLYGGTVLLLAAAMPKSSPASELGSRETVA